MEVLEAKLVQGLGAEDLRVTHLQSMFQTVSVDALRGKIEESDSTVMGIVVKELVANRQDVVGAQLVVKAGTKIGQRPGTCHRLT